MDKKMNFKYFYGTEADQFSFYRIPKALFTNECFKDLSSDAKILYGLMLDRMSLSIPDRTNRSKEMIDTVEALYRKIADPHTGIRRIEIIANKITPEGYQQYTLFQDSIKAEKERHLQEAVLQVKKRYGKNAIMRGSNLLECSTYRERNNQVGGHRA